VTGYPVLLATLRGAPPPDRDRAPAPWEANVDATCECLSWRGALGNLQRRRAEDELGATVYADVPLHARSAVVTAHSLLERGAISEHELEAKMNEVRERFANA
jgi:hypothetical protein